MSADMGLDAEQIEMLRDMAAMHAEELHPDLEPYLFESESGLPILGHRLVHQVVPIPGHANRVYEQKKRLLAEAEADQDWKNIIHCLIERPYRCEALIDYVLGMHEDGTPFSILEADLDADMRDLVAFVWTDSENIHQHVDDWLAITAGHVPGTPLLLGDEAAFAGLPADQNGRIEVWRGDCNDGGWSWTTERRIAEFFCRRWNENNDLLHGWVDKPDKNSPKWEQDEPLPECFDDMDTEREDWWYDDE